MDKLLIDIHQSLGISEIHLSANKLKFQRQPDLALLEIVEIDFEGKPFILGLCCKSMAKNERCSSRGANTT